MMNIMNKKVTTENLDNVNLVVGDKEGLQKFVLNLLTDSPFIALTQESKVIFDMLKEHGKLIEDARLVDTIIVKDMSKFMTKEEYRNYIREYVILCNIAKLKIVFVIEDMDILDEGNNLGNSTVFAVDKNGYSLKIMKGGM